MFEVVDLLEAHGVDYVLVGAYALQFNGIMRQTGDVDVLVADTPENNRRWIAALSRLPDGVVAELAGEDAPFDVTDADGANAFDDEPGVIRVADRYVVDVMPRACGLNLDDLRAHVCRVDNHGRTLNVLTLEGLRLVKQGVRPKDRMDLAMIETALAAIGERPSSHLVRMSQRLLDREAPPRQGDVTFQDMPAVDGAGTRLVLARAVVARAASDGDDPDLDAETLALYCDAPVLEALLASSSPLGDLWDAVAREGVVVPYAAGTP